MLEALLRPTYDKMLVEPVAKLLIAKNFTSPIIVTIIAASLGLLTMFALMLNLPYLAILFLLLSGYCDTLDGLLARLTNNNSTVGSMLDILSDRVVECAVIIGLFAVAPETRGWLSLGMMASIVLCISAFLLVGIFSETQSDKSFHYSNGLMERAEAFIFFIAMILFPHHFNFIAGLFIALVLYTAVMHIREFIKQGF